MLPLPVRCSGQQHNIVDLNLIPDEEDDDDVQITMTKQAPPKRRRTGAPTPQQQQQRQGSLRNQPPSQGDQCAI
ncbi:MAG: hypothetical protein WDW38_006732 [Sanguina aurantia]